MICEICGEKVRHVKKLGGEWWEHEGGNMDEVELMNYEYEAWADVVATLTVWRNDDEDLYAAIARWGERLVALREPQSDEIKAKARDEAEDAWQMSLGQSEEMKRVLARGLSRSRSQRRGRGEGPPGSNGRGEGRPSPGSNGT